MFQKRFPFEEKNPEVTFKSQKTFRASFERFEEKTIFHPVALGEEDHRRRLTPASLFLKVDEQPLLSSDKCCSSVEESCQYPSSDVHVQFSSQLREVKAHEHRPGQAGLGPVPTQSCTCLHTLNFTRLAFSWLHVTDLLYHKKDKSISLMSIFASGSLGEWLLC